MTLGTEAALEPGARLCPGYEVMEHLSRTRRYDTYEVWSIARACSCVAKLVRPDRRGDARVLTALATEGERLLRLSHPHLVRAYEVLPGPVVVMETLSGETLAHLLDRHPDGLHAEDVAWLGLQLASALRHLHGQGLLHLDVKPGNVVAESGRAYLIDLSLARPPGLVTPGVGTWSNCAPEQARGGAVDAAADVWGLGTVLFETATGAPAFDDDDDDDLSGESATGDPAAFTEPSRTWHTGDHAAAGYPQLDAPAPPVAALRPAVPAALAAAIDACLRFEPSARPSLGELADALVPLAPGARRWTG